MCIHVYIWLFCTHAQFATRYWQMFIELAREVHEEKATQGSDTLMGIYLILLEWESHLQSSCKYRQEQEEEGHFFLMCASPTIALFLQQRIFHGICNGYMLLDPHQSCADLVLYLCPHVYKAMNIEQRFHLLQENKIRLISSREKVKFSNCGNTMYTKSWNQEFHTWKPTMTQQVRKAEDKL